MRHIIFLGLFCTCLAIISSCSAASPRPSLAKTEAAMDLESFGAMSSAAPEAPAIADKRSVQSADSAVDAGSASNPASYQERKQIREGNISLEVRDLSKAELAIEAEAKKLGGHIEDTESGNGWARLRLRVPAAQFDALVLGMQAQGLIRSKHFSVQDVTLQYYDLETRLQNQRLLLDQYRAFMKEAKAMEDILEVMSRISDTTSSIEQTEGQFRYLAGLVSMSVLNIELALPVLSGGRPWPDISQGFSDLWYTLVNFAYGLLFFLISVLVYGPIIVGLAFIFVWLGFGKPALLRKLFSMVTKQKTDVTPKVSGDEGKK